jgi:ubiquinone/menaquinone biosynthesis C-methylase UbiE
VEADEYRKMAVEEDRMWWYQGLHALLVETLGTLGPFARLLDAGCGTGGFLRRAERAWPSTELDGVDRSPLAVELARGRVSRARLVEGDVHALPYPDATFDAIVLADVLYHREVDPPRALRECLRCLRPGGVVAMNAPAYEWLRGDHDVPIHSARRYTRRALVAETTAAGFSIVKATYWNTLLFPLMALRRTLFRSGGGSDVHEYPAFVDRLFRATLAIERACLRWGSAPFGGSVFVVGRRRG